MRQGFVKGNAALFAVCLILQKHCLGNLLTDSHDGVKGRQRILEDHRDLITAKLVHFLLRDTHQVLSVVQDLAALIDSVDGGDTHNCLGGYGLTGARFTNDGKSFTLVKIEGNVAYCLYLTGIRTERDLKIIY